MAVATVETIVANPARKRKNMPKRMTLKQRLHFGTARQRAAAKAAMRSKRKSASRRRATSRPRHRRRTQNPGEIIAMTLGNPAKRRKGKVAKAKARRTRTARHRTSRHNAGRRRRVYNPSRRHRATGRRRHNPASRRRRVYNPAGFTWGGVFELGVGAVAGSTLSSAGTQMILGASNTGAVGYAGNLIATLILSWVASMGPMRKFRGLAPGVLAGGVGALMKRIISDYSLFGGYTAQLGMGDYMVSNWVTPQRLTSDFRSLTEATVGQGQWGLQTPSAAFSSSGVSTRGMGLEGDGMTHSGSVGY